MPPILQSETADGIEFHHVPAISDDFDFEERIMQHLVAAARAHQLARRRERQSGVQDHPQLVVLPTLSAGNEIRHARRGHLGRRRSFSRGSRRSRRPVPAIHPRTSKDLSANWARSSRRSPVLGVAVDGIRKRCAICERTSIFETEFGR